MSKKKEYQIIITVKGDDLKREIAGDNVSRTEVVGILETVKAVIINEMINLK